MSNHPIPPQRATLPLARVVGGGSSMGGMVYTRGDQRDYDHWADLGNPGWDYGSVLYYFRKAEDYLGGHLGKTGEEGHFNVADFQPKTVILTLLKSVIYSYH